jgi:hypothetical protein
MPNESLVCYCGVYCGTCARWHEYAAFRRLAALVAELLDAHGYENWLPERTDDLRKGLDFFGRDDCWIVCRLPCRKGTEDDCSIRTCCRDRGLELCFECADFPCDRFERKEVALERAREYRELGRAAWLRRRAEQAAKGFEHHTGRYYPPSPEKNPEDA